MVVIQAETGKEAEKLYYDLVEDGVKYIGFNHSGKFYDDYGSHLNSSLRKTLGRINFIHSLRLNNDIHHHLLGTNLAEEFKYYYDLPQIKSLDTSNPIVLAFEDKEYKGNITDKPKTKMESIMNFKFSQEDSNQFSLKVLQNIYYFRNNYTL
jgi:hypothetical protein